MPNGSTHSPALTHIRVRDCLRPGTLTCGAEDSLRDVAAIMATQRIHAVVITTADGKRPVGVVSDPDGAGGYPVGVLSTLDVATVYADS